MNHRTEPIVPLAVVAIVLFFPHFAPLPFYSYALVCATAISLELQRHGERFSDLGLRLAGLTRTEASIGISAGLVWATFMKLVYIPLATAAAKGVTTYEEYDFIRRHPLNLAIALAGAWLVGGLYEEMAFRGYAARVFRNLFRNLSAARWLAAVVVSLLFGLYHWQQGILGIVPAALGGIFWSCLVMWRRENLWAAVFAHATYDTVALILIYYGRF